MSMIILFVSGMDKEVKKLEVNGYVLKHCYKSSTDADEIEMFRKGHRFVGPLKTDGRGYSFIEDEQINSFFTYFEKPVPAGGIMEAYDEAEHLIKTLRTYRTSKIGFFVPLHVDDAGRCIGYGECWQVHYSVWEFAPAFSIAENEVPVLEDYYHKTLKKTKDETINRMFKILNESYQVFSRETKLVLRTIVLEMLVDGNVELSNRISRTVAVILGQNEKESEDLFKRTKKLYDKRSHILHDGETLKADDNNYFTSLDIVRRIIMALMLTEDSVKDVYSKCFQSAYGSNPYKL